MGKVELDDYPAKRCEMHLGEKQQVMQAKCMKSFRWDRGVSPAMSAEREQMRCIAGGTAAIDAIVRRCFSRQT